MRLNIPNLIRAADQKREAVRPTIPMGIFHRRKYAQRSSLTPMQKRCVACAKTAPLKKVGRFYQSSHDAEMFSRATVMSLCEREYLKLHNGTYVIGELDLRKYRYCGRLGC